MHLEERAHVHAALSDRHRLAMVDALALGDRTPRELGALVGAPTNLVAHHLRVLEEAQLITRRASDGDRRRRYVVLKSERLGELLRARRVPASRVLFVCSHNAARSQFAAALWRKRTSRSADSAGREPAARIHPGAVAAAHRMGVQLVDAPKGYDAVTTAPSLVVSVCDLAHEGGVPFGAPFLHWSVPDPVADGRQAAFRAAFAEISRRVERLAMAVSPTTP